MEEYSQATITRAALGRLGFVGELYDVRNESLSSRSLFTSSLPKHMIECCDSGRIEFDYKFTEKISDSFNLFKVEPELQLSILCELIHLDGSVKFLTDKKNSEKVLSCSLICKFQTVCEKFYASWNEVLNNIDLKALEDGENTHVIVQCDWGANCLMSMEYHYKSESEKEEVKCCLETDLKILRKLFGAKTDVGLNKIKESFMSRSDIQIKVNADVLPKKEMPATPEDFCKIIQEVPELLKELNGGKGKPLKYVMISLSALRKLAKVDCAIEDVIVRINESFFLSTIYFFDEIDFVKRKFYDLISEMNKYEKYVLPDDCQKNKTTLKDLTLKESTLKQTIAASWTSVRRGDKSFTDLIAEVEQSKKEFNLREFESFLESNKKIRNKLARIKNCLSREIIYLGLGETFSELLDQNPKSEFFVCLISEKTFQSELGQCTWNYFLTLTDVFESKPKFVVIDEDYAKAGFFKAEITPPRCVHLKGSQLLSGDLYERYMRDINLNLAKPNERSEVEFVTHKPGGRLPLEMVCPNFLMGVCKPDLLDWSCFRCKSVIEYGFDEFFYCSCGRYPCTSYTFKCKDPKHGNDFVESKIQFLKQALSKLRTFKEINILLLGQSGVGKSTWINSIINYMNYQLLEIARKEGVICTIPFLYTGFNVQTLEKVSVVIGKKSERENTDAGHSATTCCHTYSFYWEDTLVNLIDTPGLGDTRGIEQDKKNMQNVMTYIENLKELHAVCILLKASDNRSTAFFSYCLKELLVNLHKSVMKNIVFCFTNARSTFYAPGPVATILEKLIDGMGLGKELALGPHNVFCLDNESFIFLCSLEHSNAKYNDSLIRSFEESWNTSVKETERLLLTVKNFEPHSLRDTLELYKVRSRILSLVKPLAENSKTIQYNVRLIEDKTKEIMNSDKKMKELSETLTFEEMHLEHEILDHPRTVCTKPFCVEYVLCSNSKITSVEYKTHCHPRCYLDNVQLETVNNHLLQKCTVMENGICTICGCSWSCHMHIKKSQKRVMKKLKNPKIAKSLDDEISSRKAVENFLKTLESRDKKYREENKIIIETAAKFGAFLRKNAITLYNDSLASYLEFLIEEQENKPYKSEVELGVLKNMKETLACYNEEVRILEEVIKNAGKEEVVTLKDVADLEKKLFELELTGSSIKKSVLFNRMVENASYEQTIIPLKKTKPPPKPPQGLLAKTKNFFFSQFRVFQGYATRRLS